MSKSRLFHPEGFHITRASDGCIVAQNVTDLNLGIGRRQLFSKEFIRVFVPNLKKLARLQLTGTELRVFLILCSSVEKNNYCNVSQTALANVLGITRVSVNRAFASLCKYGLVWKDVTEGGGTVWMITPNIAWRGSESDRLTSLKRMGKQSFEDIASKLLSDPIAPNVTQDV